MNSCNIIEYDCNDEALIVWIYPSARPEQKNHILKKFSKFHQKNEPFFYGQFEKEWFYLVLDSVTDSNILPGVKKISIVLWADDFNPLKYKKLCSIISSSYLQSGNPTKVLSLYLSVFIKGTYDSGNGIYSVENYEGKQLKLPKNLIKTLIRNLQLEFIFIYLGILLKKRLVFYCDSVQGLLQLFQIIPSIIHHRSDTSILHPFIDLSGGDTTILEKIDNFVAGCDSKYIYELTDLYDILVDVPNAKITVTEAVKDSLVLTKSSKEIAKYIVSLANDENSTDEQIITEISSKTEEVLSQLRSLADENDQKISAKALKGRQLSPVIETFLLQLAKSENILKD